MATDDSKRRYVGEVAYLYAYDVAYEMKRPAPARLLGQPVGQFGIESSKRSPRQEFFFRPQMVELPVVQRQGPAGPVPVRVSIKLFPVGAISISVRVPFAVDAIEDLADYHDLRVDGRPLEAEIRELAEQIHKELSPHLVRPVAELRNEEAYTVFCLHAPLMGPRGAQERMEDWLPAHRRQVAALLTQEPNAHSLADQEANESTGLALSYYSHDLVVVDWDAALVLEEPANLEPLLHIMELANVQLAELEEYDRILDGCLERSYRDMLLRRWRGSREVMGDLREIRIDLARLSDELSNITKFFGDWHLARIYQHLSTRFHLADWHRVIDEKLKTLDDLYRLLKQEQDNRWMMIMEATIILLFIIDLVVLLAGLVK